jgi:hypothetical protein
MYLNGYQISPRPAIRISPHSCWVTVVNLIVALAEYPDRTRFISWNSVLEKGEKETLNRAIIATKRELCDKGQLVRRHYGP